MGGRKSLISVLQFLTVSYHMSKLTAVITHNPSRIRPSSIGSLFMYCDFPDTPLFRPTRALLI